MKAWRSVRRVVETLLDLLYPPHLYCICCGNLIDATRTYHLCDHCMAHIRWDTAPLQQLEKPVAETAEPQCMVQDADAANGGGYASAEKRKSAVGAADFFDADSGIPEMQKLRCVQYGPYERTLIFSLKYNGKKYIARDLAQIMADRLALAGLAFDLIVPVPMFLAKQQQRGFNHAALMGQHLGKLVGKPCYAKALLRTEHTLPMRGLSPTERKLNVKGKFALNRKYAGALKGKRILLVDDFYTTGSTAEACFAQLCEASPSAVYFLAFAAK